jgi:hypothetical protein
MLLFPHGSGVQNATLYPDSMDHRQKTVKYILVWGVMLCVFITTVPITKLFAWGEGVARGEGDSGGHVLRETTVGTVRNPVL